MSFFESPRFRNAWWENNVSGKNWNDVECISPWFLHLCRTFLFHAQGIFCRTLFHNPVTWTDILDYSISHKTFLLDRWNIFWNSINRFSAFIWHEMWASSKLQYKTNTVYLSCVPASNYNLFCLCWTCPLNIHSAGGKSTNYFNKSHLESAAHTPGVQIITWVWMCGWELLQ